MEFRSNVPLYLQVVTDMKKRIISGDLGSGEKLPSTREIAVHYEINPNTAVRIYNEMEAQGIVYTKRGIGTFVSEDSQMQSRIRSEMAKQLIGDLLAELKDIGFTKEEIIKAVEDSEQKEEEKC